MLLIFLLQLINSFEPLLGAENETLCTANACFTLHTTKLSFDEAWQDCHKNGGYLMTIRDREEEGELLSLLKLMDRHHSPDLQIWIGLKLNKKDCMLADKPLKGFKWISGEEDSQYSNWKKEPPSTCAERCVRADYTFSGQDQLKWIDKSCRNKAFYACKFYFKGMCQPLDLLGPEKVTYIAPFSQEPQKRDIKLLPIGTYALIFCGSHESDYTVCNGTSNWSNPGPFCKLENPNCVIRNGGCEHLCNQKTDAVQCLCREGYKLDEDGFSCRAKDLCGPDTCEYQCVMKESGFTCKCPNGFILSENQRNCTDIDECQSELCLDHQCENTHGSYTCVCKDGYEMTDGECRDVDECEQSSCEHGCLNNAGSFSCYCTEGFILSQDGRSCADVNECLSYQCSAETTCINTVGSFMCIHQLDSNGSTESPRDSIATTTRTTEELQHQSPHTDAPLLDLVNATAGDHGNHSLATSSTKFITSRVLICVLGSVIPLLLLITLTLFIIIFRCNRSKKEVKKSTTDGYCWVSSGLDPRLEKLYESIQTDDL